ncbi:MAG: DNA repair protein RadA [Rhodospirillaceae bacterium]|nr:DNA repair protein RadA [Rhodospirillaceae bacterium]
MAKSISRFVCQSCGAVHGKWAGKCDSCGAWNSIVEEVEERAPGSVGSRAAAAGRKLDFASLSGVSSGPARRTSGIQEVDRVLGGGLVSGGAVLIGGDPGIGKSTLLLKVAAEVSRTGSAIYISGEEAIDQIRMRAERMGVAEAPVDLATATSVRDIVATIDSAEAPNLVVIDSIQTMYVDSLEAAPGTVSQVRASAQELIRTTKRRGTILLIVGHVTKEGMIAGPRVLEHMVDTVLYFEGERSHQFRILRGVKNRFGPTDEIGVFEMTERGLDEVPNPSALFLGEQENGDERASGTAVLASMEGTRPMLVEVQALVAPTAFSTPRRAVVGWDAARLHMVLAVLEARCALALAGRDVYLNMAGGLRVTEPAADLAAAAALISSLNDKPVPKRSVVFGEIGLSGEIRGVSQMDNRLKEAAKLGFESAIMPKRRASGKKSGGSRIALRQKTLDHLSDLLPLFEGSIREEHQATAVWRKRR